MTNYDPPSKTFAELGQFFKGVFPAAPTFVEKDYPKLDNKVVLITGGNTGVGYQTVKSLAGSTNAKIYVFSRSEEKTLKAIKELELEVTREYKRPPTHKIEYISADLSDLTTIKPAVEKFLSVEKRLDIVIHNAGVMHPPAGSKTKQGYELQLGTNAVGHHLLQKLLDPIFIKTARTNKPNESRIVWVASTASLFSPRGGFNFDSPNLEGVSTQIAYGQSKAINIMQSRYWPKAHSGTETEGILSVALCPGFLYSELQRSEGAFLRWVARNFYHPVRKGAFTELYAALSPDIKNRGYYISFGRQGLLRSDLKDEETNAKVWSYLEEQVAPYV